MFRAISKNRRIGKILRERLGFDGRASLGIANIPQSKFTTEIQDYSPENLVRRHLYRHDADHMNTMYMEEFWDEVDQIEAEIASKYDYTSVTNIISYPALIRDTFTSLSYLNTLDPETLKSACNIYQRNLFPASRREKIEPELLKMKLRQKAKSPRKNQKSEDSDVLIDFDPVDVHRSLQIITEFLDKIERGYLTGDVHPDFIHELHSMVSVEKVDRIMNLIPKAKDNIYARRELFELTDSILNSIDSIVLRENFRLPREGIRQADFENPVNLFKRQLKLEDYAHEQAARVRDGNLYGNKKARNFQVVRTFCGSWIKELTEAIREEQIRCLDVFKPHKDRQLYGTYLTQLAPDDIAAMAVVELLKTMFMNHRSVVGDDEQSLEGIHDDGVVVLEAKDFYTRLGATLSSELEEQLSPETAMVKESPALQKRREELIKQDEFDDLGDEVEEEPFIPLAIQMRMSSMLTYLMCETGKIPLTTSEAVSIIGLKYKMLPERKKILTLEINEHFAENCRKSLADSRGDFVHLDRALPTIYPPLKWVSPRWGGYFSRKTNLVRFTSDPSSTQSILKFTNLKKVCTSLDILGGLPWRVNRKVFQVMEKVWQSGGGIGEIPLNMKTPDYQKRRTDEVTEKLLKEEHALRCEFLLKFNIAKSYLNVEKFFFPHNMDFRGRVYPISPHLNHMGPDFNRGVLEFYEGRRLGERGLYWLKMHFANKFGQDKLQLDERVAYSEAHMELVHKMAADPFKHTQWMEAEDCWQCLAAAFELSAAMKSSKPEEHISHLHVHQDGSCNGLQHYAALGRDTEAGREVNLAQTDRPGDVYSAVARKVAEVIEIDSEDPDHPDHELALLLRGKIARKIVKQTVMTSVYGVTFIGAREQIARQLKDKKLVDDEKDLWKCSRYLAKTTLDQIKNLFEGAHRTKQWLKTCAKLLSDRNLPMRWVTPFGLPVIQPYKRDPDKVVVPTVMQNILMEEREGYRPLNKSKHQTAFPPNYIHSLDSTHMIFTAIRCHSEGMAFAAVHDSYWTHAADVDRMSEILREEFLHLHGLPLLENLKAALEIMYPDLDFPPIPERGDFNLEEVLKSSYFFSQVL